jgi:hypothetical protein
MRRDRGGVAGGLVCRVPGNHRGGQIFVFSDDDDDLPAARVAVAGATEDQVKDHLKQIGKVPGSGGSG